MKEQDRELLLQAYVDGQLDPSEVDQVGRMIQEDPAVLETIEEFRRLSQLCSLADRQVTVPMPRGPYWTRIQSQIADAPSSVVEPPLQRITSWLDLLLKFAVPSAAVFALVTTLFLLNPISTPHSKDFVVLSIDHEIETLSEDASYMTFRSEQEGLTVVWLDTSVDY